MANKLFSEQQIGTVVKVDRVHRRIGVYIPKFMPAMDSGDVINYKVPTNAGIEITDIETNISNTVTKINYIWSTCYDINEPLPDVGSKVIVFFVHNNPTLCYWMKFNANNDYKIIDEEKYQPLYNMQIGNKEFKISENDNIKIDLPEYFTAQELEDSNDHNRHFQLKENYNFYFPYGLEESITKLQQSMEFLETQYEESFITGLNNIKTLLKEDNTELSNKLFPLFDQYRTNGIKKIQDSKDLAVSNEEFKYYSKLLNGLLNTYYEYKNYKKKYLAAFPTEKPKQIPEENIDNKITYLYENSEKLATKDNIDDYVEYMEDLFSPIVSIIYKYWENDKETATEKQYDLFTKIGTNILETNENFIPSQFYKLINPNEIFLSNKFIFYKWQDSEGNLLNSDYIAMYDIAAFPLFYGLYLSINTDILKISILNQTKLEPLYDIQVNLNKDIKTFTDLNTANEYLQLLSKNSEQMNLLTSIEATMKFSDSSLIPATFIWTREEV